MPKVLIVGKEGEETRELSYFLEYWELSTVLVENKENALSELDKTVYDFVFIDESVLTVNPVLTLETIITMAKIGSVAVTLSRSNVTLLQPLKHAALDITIIQKPCDTADTLFFIEQDLSSGERIEKSEPGTVMTRESREEKRSKRYEILLKERIAGSLNGGE